jgi:enterochelin esterase-like enzyme
VYLLHGAGWNETGFLEGPPRLQQSADRLAGAQGFSEFIVVTPSVSTAGKGGVYSAAWERFVADDLVQFVDGKYRTLPHRMSRGVAGHDTGATAAFRIGMARPDVFADLYAMSLSDAASVTTDLDKYATNLNAHYSIALDVGAADPALEPNRALHAALMKLRVAHTFEEHEGDRASRLRERIEQHLLPFFARNLASPANLTSPSPGADRLAPPAR